MEGNGLNAYSLRMQVNDGRIYIFGWNIHLNYLTLSHCPSHSQFTPISSLCWMELRLWFIQSVRRETRCWHYRRVCDDTVPQGKGADRSISTFYIGVRALGSATFAPGLIRSKTKAGYGPEIKPHQEGVRGSCSKLIVVDCCIEWHCSTRHDIEQFIQSISHLLGF